MVNEFTQLCVWPETTMGEHTIEEFIQFFVDTFDTRIKFSEVIITGKDHTGQGGRSDIFFYVHTEDLPKFAVSRLNYGIRWWEDVVGNSNHHCYPKGTRQKYLLTW